MRCSASPTRTFVSQEDRRRLTREHRFKSAAEMAAQFADLPEAIENTLEIARRCAFRPKKRDPILPKFEPESGLPPAEELRRQAEAGLTRRLKEHGLLCRREGLSRPARLRARRHHPDGFSGLFPHRLRFHEMDARRRHSRRRARLGRDFAGRLGARHHQSRSHPLRSVSSSASSIPNASRCRTSTSISARSGATKSCAMCSDKYGEDRVAHIIALGSLQARAAVRDVGPGAANAARPGRPHRQADPQSAGQIHFARRGHSERAPAASDRRTGADRRTAVRHRAPRSKGFIATPRPIPPAS